MYEIIYSYLIIIFMVFLLIDFKITIALNMRIAPDKDIKEVEDILRNSKLTRYIAEIVASLFWPYLLFEMIKIRREN